MPQKRPHKKSRYGCDQCRKRRVKCDEATPRCSTCTERGDECRFPPRQIGQDEKARRSTKSGSVSNRRQRQPPSTGSSIEAPTAGINYPFSPWMVKSAATDVNTADVAACPSAVPPPFTDAALIHHWCTRTCDSFTPAKAALFRGHVAHEAFRHAHLMDALRALTLLHMATEVELRDPVAAGPLVATALRHVNRCCCGLREVLEGYISPSNCDAVYASAVLLMVCGLVSPLVPMGAGHEQKPEPNVACVLRLIEFMNGIKSILQLSRPWIMQGPMSAVFTVFETTPNRSVDWAPARALRALLSETQAARSSQYTATMDSAIQGLERVFRREHCSVVWLTRLDPEFVVHLRNGDPSATLICLHWAVLLHNTDDMWWKRYSGAKLVEELSGMLQGHDPDWYCIVTWTRRQVGLAPDAPGKSPMTVAHHVFENRSATANHGQDSPGQPAEPGTRSYITERPPSSGTEP